MNAEMVAERWQVSSATIRNLARAGSLKSIRIGKRIIRFKLSDVEAYERDQATS